MKYFYRTISCFLLIVSLTIFAGCSNNSNQNKTADTNWNLADAKPVYVTEWPENEFTAKIIKPEHGKMDYVLDYSDSGHYGVWIKDISKDESSDYIRELKKQGYSEMASEGNNVAVGTLLHKDNVALSISYSDASLGVLITIEK